MRTQDYKFYSTLLLVSGVVLIGIGVILPYATAYQLRYVLDIFPPEWRFPYLAHGIVLVVIGILLVIVGFIFSREYRIRTIPQALLREPIPKPSDEK